MSEFKTMTELQTAVDQSARLIGWLVLNKFDGLLELTSEETLDLNAGPRIGMTMMPMDDDPYGPKRLQAVKL